jgi:hypothetical protein
VTLRWASLPPLTVESDALGTPCCLLVQGRRYAVEAVAARWRVRQRWWGQPVWREYAVVAHGPLLLLLVRELPHGAWALDALFD